MLRSARDRAGRTRLGHRGAAVFAALRRNWGMGDFRDLRELIRLAAPLGCSIIGLNPLHALMPANPAHISPYSPSNRQFLNVLYIAVEDVPDFAECEAARERFAEPEFQAMLRELRATDERRLRARRRARSSRSCKLLYAQLPRAHSGASTPRAEAFRQFVEIAGRGAATARDLRRARRHLRLQGPQYWGWPSWPEEYRDPTSPAVNRFARERVRGRRIFPVSAVARGRAARAAQQPTRAQPAWRSGCTATSPSARIPPARKPGRIVTCICRAHRWARRPMRWR